MINIEIMYVGNNGNLYYIYLADTNLLLALGRFRAKCKLPVIRVMERPMLKGKS
jgi:hypothetical protein